MKNSTKKMKTKSEKMRTALRMAALVLLLGAGLGQLAAQPLPKGKTGKGTREDDDKPQMFKSVNAAGDLLTLESYVTGKISAGEVIPTDICLVLDMSGSMNDDMKQSKYSALLAAVRSFIDIVHQNAVDNNVDHKIAIVKFADGFKTSDISGVPYHYIAPWDLTEGNWYFSYYGFVLNLTQVVKKTYLKRILKIKKKQSLNLNKKRIKN